MEPGYKRQDILDRADIACSRSDMVKGRAVSQPKEGGKHMVRLLLPFASSRYSAFFLLHTITSESIAAYFSHTRVFAIIVDLACIPLFLLP